MARKNNNDAVFNRMLRDIEKLVLYPSLVEYGHRLVSLIRDTLEKEKIYASGDLIKSITQQVIKKLNLFQVLAGTNLKYAKWVHEGTDPHWAPIAPIIEWVKIKRIGAVMTKGGNISKSKSSIQSQKSLAYAIRGSIAKKGTKAHPFLDLVYEQEESRSASEISNMIRSRIKLAN